MTFREQLTLLLVGAGIALVSSLMTTILTSVLSNWLSRLSTRAAKREKLWYLTGRYAALSNESPEETGKAFWQEARTLGDLTKSKGCSIDGYIGLIESWITRLEQLQQQTETQQTPEGESASPTLETYHNKR